MSPTSLGAASGRSSEWAEPANFSARMFDIRYHALSLAAVFIALVVGLSAGRRDR